jgi:hypothetical protein
MNPLRPRFSMRTLLALVALSAALIFAAARLDIPDLPRHALWRGWDSRTFQFSETQVLVGPRLAYWVLPLTTVMVLGNPRGTASGRVGLGLVCVALASWVVLRRPVVGFGGLDTWPDYYIHFYIRRLYTKLEYRAGSPPIWIIYPSLGEVVDLLWLTAFLGLAVRRIRGMTQNQTFGVALGLLANLQVIAEISRELWLWAGFDPHGTRSGLVAYEKATN